MKITTPSPTPDPRDPAMVAAKLIADHFADRLKLTDGDSGYIFSIIKNSNLDSVVKTMEFSNN